MLAVVRVVPVWFCSAEHGDGEDGRVVDAVGECRPNLRVAQRGGVVLHGRHGSRVRQQLRLLLCWQLLLWLLLGLLGSELGMNMSVWKHQAGSLQGMLLLLLLLL